MYRKSNYTKDNNAQIDPCSLTFIPEKRSFKAHRLILACHSEYFHRMFISCGMREVSGEVNTKYENDFISINEKQTITYNAFLFLEYYLLFSSIGTS